MFKVVSSRSKVDVIVKMILELLWDQDSPCNTYMEGAGIRVVDAECLYNSSSSWIMLQVEEVIRELEIFQSSNDPDMSVGARIGSLSLKPKHLKELGENNHWDEVGQVDKEDCIDA